MKSLLLFLVLPLTAHASWFEFEAGAGLTSYKTVDGRWYQQRMEHSMTTLTPEYSVGITGPVISRGMWGVDWHVDYVNLGRASASCQCDTSDEDYAARRTRHTALFSGSGRAQGVTLTLEPYHWYAGLRWGVEAGAWLYRSSWNETVTGWTVSDAPVQNISLSAHRWNASYVAGASIGNDVWSVSYRHYFMHVNSSRQSVPPLWNDADVIEFKRRF